jgi:hypothetical protein
MKEFENHFTEGCILDVFCGDMKCRDCKRIAEYWWRAALQWALKQKTKVCIDDDCNPPVEIVYIDIIEEELLN